VPDESKQYEVSSKQTDCSLLTAFCSLQRLGQRPGLRQGQRVSTTRAPKHQVGSALRKRTYRPRTDVPFP